MRIETTEIGDVSVVGINGKLDTGTAPELETHLNEMLTDEKTNILLDFSNLDFIASTGLRVLLSTGKKLKKMDGEIRICSLNDTVQSVFVMSGFSDLFKLYKDQESAIKDF